MELASFSKVEVPRLEEDVFGDFPVFEFHQVDEMTKLASHATGRAMEVFARDRSEVIRKRSKTVKIISKH